MTPQRDNPASKLGDNPFDVLVVGGGITGACVALEATARGLRTALVDQGDFGHGATANCLRIVHGGLRYLQHLDLRRARESIRERSMWLRSAPHLVEPLPTLVPAMRGEFPPRWLLGAALALNDLLSADRNRNVPRDRELPAFRILSRRNTLDLAPALDDTHLTGSVLFHDALMYSPERLTLEVILAAKAAGAVVANHVSLESAARDHAGFQSSLRDRLTGDDFVARSRWLVNASGSHVGEVAQRILGGHGTTRQRYSVALNLVTNQPMAGPAFTMSGGAGDPDRVHRGARRLFAVPWRGQLVLGTAHFPFDGDPAAASLSERWVDDFLNEVRTARPAMRLVRDDVRVAQWGLLPIAASDSHGHVQLLKRHRVLDHARDGVAGAWSVVSVKFTGARRVADDVIDRLTPRRRSDESLLALPGRLSTPVSEVIRDAQAANRDLDGDIVEHLVRAYGSRHEHVLALARRVAGGTTRVTPMAPVIEAQLQFAVDEELACTEDDLLWRRCELGPRGLVTKEALALARRVLRKDERAPATPLTPDP